MWWFFQYLFYFYEYIINCSIDFFILRREKFVYNLVMLGFDFVEQIKGFIVLSGMGFDYGFYGIGCFVYCRNYYYQVFVFKVMKDISYILNSCCIFE